MRTLFSWICHVLSVGCMKMRKSLGYRTCGRTYWLMAVRGVPLHNFFKYILFLTFVIFDHLSLLNLIVPQFCQDSTMLLEHNNPEFVKKKT